jgi:hypothetical protein
MGLQVLPRSSVGGLESLGIRGPVGLGGGVRHPLQQNANGCTVGVFEATEASFLLEQTLA